MLQIVETLRKHSIHESVRLTAHFFHDFFLFQMAYLLSQTSNPDSMDSSNLPLAKRTFVLFSQKQLGISLQLASTVLEETPLLQTPFRLCAPLASTVLEETPLLQTPSRLCAQGAHTVRACTRAHMHVFWCTLALQFRHN